MVAVAPETLRTRREYLPTLLNENRENHLPRSKGLTRARTRLRSGVKRLQMWKDNAMGHPEISTLLTRGSRGRGHTNIVILQRTFSEMISKLCRNRHKPGVAMATQWQGMRDFADHGSPLPLKTLMSAFAPSVPMVGATLQCCEKYGRGLRWEMWGISFHRLTQKSLTSLVYDIPLHG